MKKIFLLSLLLSQLVIAFGQTVGTIVKSKTIFSSLGVTVSYTVTYYGIIDCNNNSATGHKKYRLNFNAQNNSSSTVRLVASRIDLDDNLDRYKSNCYSSEAILLGSYPGFEQFGTLVPGENVNATKYVYMDQRSADLPYVTYNFVASTVPNKNQTQANSQAPVNTNNQQNNYNNQFIQQALSEFNQLLPKVPNSPKKTEIYNDVQKYLNGNYSEQAKLNVLNDAIYKFRNLSTQPNYQNLSSNNFKELTDREISLVKEIKAKQPNADAFIYEGNIGENVEFTINSKKQNIAKLEKTLENINLNSNYKPVELTNINQVGTTNQNIQSQSGKSDIGSQVESSRPQSADALKSYIGTINSAQNFMQSLASPEEDKETLDKMKSFELAKLEVEPEFNVIESVIDYNKVSFTTLTYRNLYKLGNVAVSIVRSALSNVDKAKEKAFKSAKIQAAFLGANTVQVKVLEMGSKKLGSPYNYPTTDFLGVAFIDKKINFELFKAFIETNKNLKINQLYTHVINSADYNSQKINKSISISNIFEKDGRTKITALIPGEDETTFTVINFNLSGFTLMSRNDDKKRIRIHNYVVIKE